MTIKKNLVRNSTSKIISMLFAILSRTKNTIYNTSTLNNEYCNSSTLNNNKLNNGCVKKREQKFENQYS